MKRILLDTDIGGDFDDANALAFLAALPDVELVAVTTVGAGGDATKRARLASYVLELAGCPDVPVHAGIDHPIVGNPALDTLPPDVVLNAYDDCMSNAKLSSQNAVEAILDAASKYQHELTLVCIGALTNVAAAIQRNKSTMRRIGRVVLMAGAYRTQYREANIAIDPEAAVAVFRAGLPITAVGYEEARRSAIPLSAYDERTSFATSPLGALYRSMARRYSSAYTTDSVTLYDVTAAAAAVRPQWFQFEQIRVAVELHGRFTRGMTVVEQDSVFNVVADAAPLSVARDHDADAVLKLFSDTVLHGAWPSRS